MNASLCLFTCLKFSMYPTTRVTKLKTGNLINQLNWLYRAKVLPEKPKAFNFSWNCQHLWSSKIHHLTHKSPPHHPRLCDTFYNMVRFCREELLAPCPNCKLEYRILSSARDGLYNIFAATLSTWRSLLLLQHEDSPCCVTGTNASEI